MENRTLAIDADGALLDYNRAYAQVWEKAFGYAPKVRVPAATNFYEHFDVPILIVPELQHLKLFFNDDFWSRIPATPNAVEACSALVNAGYDIVCVTALSERFQDARVENLRLHKLPISKVYTMGGSSLVTHSSPTLETLIALTPTAFVDDYQPYFYGVPSTMHRAFIADRDHAQPMDFADSSHSDIGSFAKAWLQRMSAL